MIYSNYGYPTYRTEKVRIWPIIIGIILVLCILSSLLAITYQYREKLLEISCNLYGKVCASN